MLAVFLNQLLDELVRLPEGWILPPAFIVTMHHRLEDLLRTLQQFILAVSHLLKPFQLQLLPAQLLDLLQRHRPGFLQEWKQLVIFEVGHDIVFYHLLQFGNLQEVDHLQCVQCLTSAYFQLQSVQAREHAGQYRRLHSHKAYLKRIRRMQAAFTLLIIQNMQVDVLEDNRPMHGQEGILMVYPEIGSLSVEEEKTAFGIDLVQLEQDLTV